MTTSEKLKTIETLPTEGVIISPVGNQSFKVEHSCGCYFVQHGFTNNRFKQLSEETKIDRSFWVELCDKHNIPSEEIVNI